MVRLPHGLIRLDRDPLSPIETQAIADGVIPEDRKEIFRGAGRGRLRLFGCERRAVPRERVPPARVGLDGPAEAALRRPELRRDRAPGRRADARGRAPRADPRDRPDRLGQDDDARRDDRLLQRDEARAHRHDRGPHRGAAQGRGRVDQPARDRQRHRGLPGGAPRRPAPGPRRDLDRGDARHRDRARRAAGGRDRSPRALDAAHAGRDRDREPRDRLLPAAPAEADPADARRHPQGDHLPATGADGRRRASAGARDPREHRSRGRADHRRGEDLGDQGRGGRGGLLRHGHLRPVRYCS